MTADHIARTIFHAATWRAMHGVSPLIAAGVAIALAIWFLSRRRR